MLTRSRLASEQHLREKLRCMWDERAGWCSDKDANSDKETASIASSSKAWVPKRNRQAATRQADAAVLARQEAMRLAVRDTLITSSAEDDDESVEGMTNETLSKATSPGLRPLPAALFLRSDVLSLDESLGAVSDDADDETETRTYPPLPTTAATLDQEVTSALRRGSLTVEACSDDNASGVFFLKHRDTGLVFAVAKPANREVASEKNPNGFTGERKEGFAPGKGVLREVFAFQVDRKGFAGVPETVLMDLPEELFDGEHTDGEKVTCSVQRFVRNDGQSWDCGPLHFSESGTRRIGLLDLRLLNCDRHGGNILLDKRADGTALIPIDHGFTLPTSMTDLDFEWQLWKQAETPFSDEEKQYVADIDIDADVKMAEDLGIEEEAVACFRAASVCLKIGCASGLTLNQLASFFRRQRVNEPSGLELVISESRYPLDHPQAGSIDFDHLATRVEQIIAGDWREALH